MPYRHVVLFRVHDDVDEATVAAAERRLVALGDVPGVLEWTVRRSDDDRKGLVLVENGLLADRAALDALRADPRHREATDLLRDIADWSVGDYAE